MVNKGDQNGLWESKQVKTNRWGNWNQASPGESSLSPLLTGDRLTQEVDVHAITGHLLYTASDREVRRKFLTFKHSNQFIPVYPCQAQGKGTTANTHAQSHISNSSPRCLLLAPTIIMIMGVHLRHET